MPDRDLQSDLPVQGMWIDLQKARWAMDPCDLRDRIDKAIRSKFGQNEVPGVGPFTESPPSDLPTRTANGLLIPCSACETCRRGRRCQLSTPAAQPGATNPLLEACPFCQGVYVLGRCGCAKPKVRESPLQVRPMDPTVKAARESVTLTSYEIELEAERDALRADLEAIHVDAARVNQENNALRSALRDLMDYCDPDIEPPSVNIAAAVYNTAKQALNG